jgi:hypothetical protein
MKRLIWLLPEKSARICLLLAVSGFLASNMAFAGPGPTPNPGDPLFCQPNEGTTFLIVNGGAGVFTVDGDCFNNNPTNNTTLTISTGMGGTLNGTNLSSNTTYVYTPPTPTFTGLDTFSIPVTTVWNSAGGPGSAGGSARPGAAATLNITLNVIPSTTTLNVPFGVPTSVPVPAGSVTGCTAPGNASQGPTSSAVVGCVTGIVKSFTTETIAPSHGTLTTSGNALLYTPNVGYSGPDTFTYQAVGTNTDGSNALDSGDVTVTVTVPVSTTPVPSSLLLMLAGLAMTGLFFASGKFRRAE